MRCFKPLPNGLRAWPLAITLFPACAGAANQSALAPAASQAADISTLWWAMFYGACVIFVVVMLLLAIGLWRARGTGNHSLSWSASRNLVTVAGVLIPLAVLIFLVGGSLMLGRNLSAEPPPDALTVEVTGWRWWWEVRYLDDNGEPLFTTANELHVPVGQPIALRLRAGDVIHSFWVPNLHGKTDLVPGRINTSWFEASETGTFRGQCAEFCGAQHALMAFLVVVQSEQEFQDWLANQKRPAPEPETEVARQGKEIFMAECQQCHTVRGTGAAGTLGPDLTHFGSRLTLAAATRPSSRGHIAGWIADPQSIKPGNFMPPTRLEPENLTAVTTYLQSLE